MPKPLVLLGPQRRDPNLPKVLKSLGVDGPLVVISAGWRHDEDDLDALQAAVGPVTSLPLYAWFDQLAVHAPDVAGLYRERQKQIKLFKDLYRLRLHSALSTVRQLVRMPSTPLVQGQIESASKVVRGIDAEALAAVDRVRSDFSELSKRFEDPWIQAKREEVAAQIASAGAVLITGGHVAVLRNRMMFFGAEHALASALDQDRPVIGWGAGAMVLTEHIVLFYDDAPDGPAEPEVLDHGMNFAPELVLFPHANVRLRLEDSARVAALAHRFGPKTCIGLEKGAWLQRTEDGWRSAGAPDAAIRLQLDGTVCPVEAM